MPGGLVIGDRKFRNKPGFTGHFCTLSDCPDTKVELDHACRTILIPTICKMVAKTGLSGNLYELLSLRKAQVRLGRSATNPVEYDTHETPHNHRSEGGHGA